MGVIEDILQREGMAEQKNTRPELPSGAGNKLGTNVAVSTPNTKPLDCYLKYVGNDGCNESYSKKMKNRGLDGAVCEGECSCDAADSKDSSKVDIKRAIRCSLCRKVFQTLEELQKHNTSPLGRWLARIKRKYSK